MFVMWVLCGYSSYSYAYIWVVYGKVNVKSKRYKDMYHNGSSMCAQIIHNILGYIGRAYAITWKAK